MRKALYGLALLAPVLLTGCGGSSVRTVVEVIDTIRRSRDNDRNVSISPDPQAVKEILALTPTGLPEVKSEKGGVSVAVFEPQTAASPPAKAFGNGCGRWLQLHVAGLPGLAGSPTWYGWDYGLREHGLENGGPSQQQAFGVGKSLAVSHVATGQLEGTGEKQTLIYRLWKLPELQPVGAPLKLSGSRQEIAAALPVMAHDLAQRLGVASKGWSPRLGLNASQLTELGKLPRLPQEPLPEAQAALVQKWAPSSPLAGMFAVAHLSVVYGKDDDDRARQALAAAARRLAQLAGQNCLVLAQVAAYDAVQLSSAPHWQALLAKYPHNYALAYTRANWHKSNEDREEQRQAALAVLSTAPQSAWAWLQWDELLGAEAQDVRRARYITKMNQEELDYIGQRYPQMVQTCLKAVQCDPLNASAWLRLSRAAAFDGDGDLADNAYRQAMSLPSRDAGVYLWGLQLYQPKWYRSSAKLSWVARSIRNNNSLFLREHQEVIRAFKAANMAGDQYFYDDKAQIALEKRLAQYPRDRFARTDLAYLFKSLGNVAGANEQFQILIQQFPEEEDGYLGMAGFHESKNDWAQAWTYYEKAIQRDAVSRVGLFRGGQSLHQMGQYDKAEALYHKAIELYPQDADAYNRLADLHRFVKNDPKGAERLYRKAIELAPDVELFQQNLDRLLGQ